MGVGRGVLKISAGKGCFLSLEWEKTNFTTFGSPFGKKILEKCPSAPPPLEKSFRRPWLDFDLFAAIKRVVQCCCCYRPRCSGRWRQQPLRRCREKRQISFNCLQSNLRRKSFVLEDVHWNWTARGEAGDREKEKQKRSGDENEMGRGKNESFIWIIESW